MAAKEGYDVVAWTSGKIQADRYDLSRQVDNIKVTPRTNAVTGESSRSVDITTPDGPVITLGVDNAGVIDNTGASNIDEINVLKGKHLSDVVGKEMADKIMKNTAQTVYKDVDLKVGGEGMKAFYDKILKNYASKWGKKFGAKVSMDWWPSPFGKSMVGATPDRVDAYWLLPITEKMRDTTVRKGVPLFSVAPPVAAVATGAAMQEERSASEQGF